MVKKNFKIFSYFLMAVFLTLGLSVSFQALLAAWTAPHSTPPICITDPLDPNYDAACNEPVNRGNNQQSKMGPLYVNTANDAFVGLVAFGKVGIGIATPVIAKLEVHEGDIRTDNANNASLTALSTDTNSRSYLALIAKNAAGTQREWRINNNFGNWLTFYDANADSNRMVIDSNGNVGIGTTSPGTLFSLGNTGVNTINISATATSTFGTGINLRTGCFAVNGVCVSGSGGNIVDTLAATLGADNNAGGINMVNLGNVGIGTTSPKSKLEVVGSANQPQFLVDAAASQTAANSIIQIKAANGSPIFGIYADSFSNFFMGLDAGKNTVPWFRFITHTTFGSGNIALGNKALYLNTDGGGNIALGHSSLYSNTGGVGNIALGTGALYSNTTGSNNSAIGHGSLSVNTTGAYNVGLGENSLISNTTGNDNTAVGFQASFINSTGSYNTAVGANALYTNRSSANVAVGVDALLVNTTGYQNIAVGNGSLGANTTGYNNTAVGYNAGSGIVTGVNNTIIGANVTGLAAGLSNNIIIADGAGNRRINVDADGNVGIGIINSLAKLSVQGTVGLPILNIASSTGESLLYINENGKVGIGTVAPGARLDLGQLPAATEGLRIKVGATTPFSPLVIIKSDGTDAFRVKENGNVGIGTAAPTSKLQVVGLLEYADNAAATAAGLTIGALYRTGDILKVVH